MVNSHKHVCPEICACAHVLPCEFTNRRNRISGNKSVMNAESTAKFRLRLPAGSMGLSHAVGTDPYLHLDSTNLLDGS